jgi:leucyl aminopeptidase (aminopeptidase T)
MHMLSVVEARDEYLRFEMARASRVLVDDVLMMKPGQTVVITADSGSDARVVWSNASAIYAAGGTAIVIWYHQLPRPQMEIPEAVSAALCKADIWIEHAVAYSMYTPGWHRALEAGVLYCELSAMDVDGMVRCIGRQSIGLMAQIGEELKRLLSESIIRVTSHAGTDVTFSNVGCVIGAFAMQATPEKTPIMLPGQVSWTPVETSLNGRLVADGILYPPTEVGILASNVTFEVHEGRIIGFEGEREAALLRKWFGTLESQDEMDRIAHVSLGFNPGIPMPTGRFVEDERAFGDIDFGFGAWVGRPAAGHFDFTCRQISLWANDVQLMDEGVFVEPEIARLCREMSASR